jgi:hypothetical protein
MLALIGPVTFAALSTTWIPLGAGTLVACMVFGFAVVYGRLRRRADDAPDIVNDASREEDLPWAELLAILEKRNRERAAAGLPPEKATEEVLRECLKSLPDAKPVERPEDKEFHALAIDERRVGGQRRWGNPVTVQLSSPLWDCPLNGIVVNRSTGGLGILTDQEVPAGTRIEIRPTEAPWYVQPVPADVRHCGKVGKGFLFGCEFSDDVPWKARVWFG